MSPEERARMKLLRELSRLQDEQGTLRSASRRLNERWRKAVGQTPSTADARRAATGGARNLRRKLQDVNDARLGREGRTGLLDALEAAESLERLAENDETRALQLAEKGTLLRRALEAARDGSAAEEPQGKRIRAALRRARDLERRLHRDLPPAPRALPQKDREALEQAAQRQQGLRQQTRALMGSPTANPLPPAGQQALRQALRSMEDGRQDLSRGEPGRAGERADDAYRSLQRAIDSLRQGSPPPPAGATGEASTEAEQDRSLRDALLEAMREGAPPGYDEPVSRYYEELLK